MMTEAFRRLGLQYGLKMFGQNEVGKRSEKLTHFFDSLSKTAEVSFNIVISRLRNLMLSYKK